MVNVWRQGDKQETTGTALHCSSKQMDEASALPRLWGLVAAVVFRKWVWETDPLLLRNEYFSS